MKYVKYAVIAIAPVILIVGLLVSMSGGPEFPDRISVVNVVTGEVLKMPYKTKGGFPTTDDSGEEVIYPASIEDDGTVLVSPRYQELLMRKLGDRELAVDKTTFVVTPK